MSIPIGRSSVPKSVRHLGRAALYIVAIVALGRAPGAGATVPLTIAAAEDLAIAAEPGYLALVASGDAFAQRATAAGELPAPMLRIGLNNFPLESGGFATEGMTHAALALRQEFPAGRTRALSRSRFERLAAAQGESANARRREVLAAVRQSWLELYFWQQAADRVNASRPFLVDLAGISRSLYAVGRRGQQDVYRAELELSRLDDRLLEIESRRAVARASLSEWIGFDATRPVADKLPAWDSLPPLASLRESLLAHPALKAADAQIAARDDAVAIAGERSRPEWAVDLGYSFRDGRLPSGQPRSDFVSLNLTVGLPFVRRRAIDGTLSAALAERSAARAERKRMHRWLDGRVEAEYARWQEVSRRLSLYETRILGQARDQASASLTAYQNDRADFADVMRAYIDDLDTQIDYVRLQVDRAQSYAALASLGGLSE